MINSVRLKLSNGYYEIVAGTDFCVLSDTQEHLQYEDRGVGYIESDSCAGIGGINLITIPKDSGFNSFIVYLENGAIKAPSINAHKIYIELKNSAGEFDGLKADKIGLSLGKGSLRANVNNARELNIDCGMGNMDIRLGRKESSYKITSKHGMGVVNLNSKTLPRVYETENGENYVNIICGMGGVNINTL